MHDTNEGSVSPAWAPDPGGPPSHADGGAIPVVAIGASAGGLEALRGLFTPLPTDTGMAFVVIQHLDPDRRSMLTKVLDDISPLPVVEATDGMHVAENRIHVIPPEFDLSIREGVLYLIERQKTGRLHLPIDTFFRALADDHQARPVGVVLSGSGADGTEGLRAIKAEGGIAIAQDPDSAAFRSMPESAISAGVVDYRGTPAAIATELARLSRHLRLAPTSADEELTEPRSGDGGPLAEVFALLRQHTGADFTGYKRKTVLRRIERRMALRHVEELAGYTVILRDDPGELNALAEDMLIHVTSFFREPEAFEALAEHVFPKIVLRKQESASIRIWVPGCSTGEEAYSIAISLLEFLGDRAARFSIQIFGTDLAEDAVQSARTGVYSESALTGLSPERLSRFFDTVEGGYRIGKRVRDLCIFVRHDLTRDPPFARLDLVSCRNVLIYFDAELQRRVIPLLHHCLNDEGYLFLGQSETISGFRDVFAPVDKRHAIFVKIGDSPHLSLPLIGHEPPRKLGDGGLSERRHPAREAQRQVDHLLLARYTPPGVVVNDRLEIVQFRGRTGTYLEPPPGQPQTNLLRMVREGLAPHVYEATERAKTQAATVRKEGLRVQIGAEVHLIDLEVIPLATIPGSVERYFLVLFEESGPLLRAGPAGQRELIEQHPEAAFEVDRLKAELLATKDYLQALISEHQLTTDDLAAMNEEMVAANEELQSTNEELQSAKEELQSTNEELSTVNDQLRNRNQELDQVASDLVNVLSSVQIPIIIVDLGLRVRLYTPALRNIASFIPEDVGRPIEDLNLRIAVDDLSTRIRRVIEDVAPRDWEIQGVDGRWFRMQIRPYRTTDHRLDGAVLSFVDVDALKKARQEAEGARDYARAIVETLSTSLLVLDSSLRVVSANGAFFEAFASSREGIQQRSVFELGGGMWDTPAVRRALEATLTEASPFAGLELATEAPEGGRRVFSLTGRAVVWSGSAPLILLSIDDVTALRALESERSRLLDSEKQARIEAERATRAKDVFLAVLSHELRTPLSTMLMSAQLLEQVAAADPKVARASAAIKRAASAQARLIDDLLDVSRIVSGKLLLNLGPVDFESIVRDVVDLARASAKAKSLELDLVVDGSIGVAYGDAARLQQVVNNLLSNALKFTPHGGRISVRLERKEDRAILTVSDTGMGIRPEVIPQLFSRFVQADSSVTRTHGGLGLGLAIVRHLVEVHGGSVEAESPGEGRGATFRVTLPLGVGEPYGTPPAPRPVVQAIDGVRVLLVEDDDDTRESYATMLAELGAVVHAVPSASQGIEVLERFRPQVILSDIAMPGEDGLSFIRRVRRLGTERGGTVPAAALTALASDEDRRQALEAGFQVHVSKPVDAAQLASTVSLLANWKFPEIGSEPRSQT